MQDGYNHVTHNDVNKDRASTIGLLSLVNKVKDSLDISHTNNNKKLEDLEFQLLEKEEALSQLNLEINTLKSQSEAKDLEIYKLHEEIKASKQMLEQIVTNLNKTQH